jgi:hypothetical protein
MLLAGKSRRDAVINLFCLIILALLIFSLARSFRQRKNPEVLSSAEVGVVIDRALQAYRRRLVPLLALAALLTPLGVASPLLAPLALQLIWPMRDSFFSSEPPTAWLLAGRAAAILSALGLGRSLLMYGAACALAEPAQDQSLRTIAAAVLRDWRRALLLAIPLSAPSMFTTLVVVLVTLALLRPSVGTSANFSLIALMIVGLPLMIILGLTTDVRWALAPAAMRYESLKPIAAIRRSAQIVRAQRSGMSNVTLGLWLIGWLMVSVPVAGGLLAWRLIPPPVPDLSGQSAILIWMLGSVFVAPLLALGPVELYLCVRDRALSPALTELLYVTTNDQVPSKI